MFSRFKVTLKLHQVKAYGDVMFDVCKKFMTNISTLILAKLNHVSSNSNN